MPSRRRDHSSNSSSHGQRGRRARVRTSAIPPHARRSAARRHDQRRTTSSRCGRRPRSRRRGPRRSRRRRSRCRRRRRGSSATAVHSGAPERRMRQRAAPTHSTSRERARSRAPSRRCPGIWPRPGRLDDVGARATRLTMPSPKISSATKVDRRETRARRAGGPGRRRSPRALGTPTRGRAAGPPRACARTRAAPRR